MSTAADTIYQLIKSNETNFPIPAPYVTLNMGTFDAASGVFSGLATTSSLDPEPIEHGPTQRPTNPAPGFRGAEWVSVTTDARWRRTTTSSPAPILPVAPVLLEFAIANATTSWSVIVNGVTVTAPSTQQTITVSIWDAILVRWSVQAGAQSHTDTLRIQRPAGVVGYGVGAFTIPVLPVSILYAPPVDSLGKSVASYVAGQTVGTTVSTSFESDSTHTAPGQNTEYGQTADFSAVLNTLSQSLSLVAATAGVGKVIGDISTQIGKFSESDLTGISNSTESQSILIQTTTDSISTLTSAGGPGVGDILHFYTDVRMAWAYADGQLKLTPLDWNESLFPVGGFQKNLPTLGISAADAQMLLALDPFVAGGPQVQLDPNRFTLQETWDYGFGTIMAQQVTVTRDTKDTTTQKSLATTTTEWDAGPIFELLGFGGKDSTTITLSNATGTDVSSTVSMNANLVSGPSDHFLVDIYYDNLFGTLAFQPGVPATSAVVQGTGATPAQQVTLTSGGQVFRTVVDQNGQYAFHSPAIPAGAATIAIGNQPGQSVMVAPQ